MIGTMRRRWFIDRCFHYVVLSMFVAVCLTRGRCTTVILYRDSNKIVVGADTLFRLKMQNDGWKSVLACKIRKTGAVYVALSGFAIAPPTMFDSYRLASQAIRSSDGVVASAKRFTMLTNGPFQEAVRFARLHDPAMYQSEIEKKAEPLVALF